MGCSSGSVLEVDAPATSEYVIQRGDRLRIRVWPDSTLNGDYPVEEDGQAYLPVLGSLPVAGVPLAELRGTLRAEYSQEMKDPTVSVTPLFRVSVLGAVQRPGLYEIDPTQGVIDAISMAGGFRENAEENSVTIIRKGEVMELNAEEASGSGPTNQDWQLQSGDRIVVPRGWGISIRDVLYVLQGAALVLTLYGQTQD